MNHRVNQFRLLTVLLTALFFNLTIKAQVTIGSQAEPQPFSLLEITTANVKGGLRLPQLSETERNNLKLSALSATDRMKAKGLIIFNTTSNCINYWDYNAWIPLCGDAGLPSDSWSIHGNLGTIPSEHFFGTRDNQPIAFRVNNMEYMRLTQGGTLGIGTTGPNSNAILDLSSPNKGLLLPRVALISASNPSPLGAHVAGMVVYNTTTTREAIPPGQYYNDGTQWVRLLTDYEKADLIGRTSVSGWELTGNAGTNAATHFIGTTTEQPLMFKVNNVHGGRISYYSEGPTSFGNNALAASTGNFCSAFGNNALKSNMGTGTSNTAMGNSALATNRTGSYNTAMGYSALTANSIGMNNTGIGAYALYHNVEGEENVAVGDNALYHVSNGKFNVALGGGAGTRITLGQGNTALGTYAMGADAANLSAAGTAEVAGNTAVGMSALRKITSGSNNIAIGIDALSELTTGHDNVVIGNGLSPNLVQLGIQPLTTGYDNILIGHKIHDLTTGYNNIIIGHESMPSTPSTRNQITIGNSLMTSARVLGLMSGWTFSSDRRLKHDIKPIEQGLDFVMKLKPVEFIYNNREDNVKTLGFIAQDVQQVMNEAGMTGYGLVPQMDENTLGLNSSELIPVLTNAIQEQQKIIEQLEARLKALEEK